MEVVRNQGKSKTPGLCFVQYDTETVEKDVPVVIVTEDDPSFDTSRNDVVQCTNGVYSGVTRHGMGVS